MNGAATPPAALPRDVALEVSDLGVAFDGDDGPRQAVDGVSFELGRGRVLALVGESGCGKSVIAHAILRLLEPPGRLTGGRIVLHPAGRPAIEVTALGGHDPALYALRGGLVGMVFQEPMAALSPVHSIGAHIVEAIRLHRKVSRREARRQAGELLHRVGIPGPQRCLDRYPHELSGGMRQRALIAVALAAGPEILIADEPTTALDVTLQAQILGLIKRLQADMGCSVLLITHNMGVVAQVADDVAVMYLGRVVEVGPVARVLKVPRHPYTMALIQSIAAAAGDRARRLVSIAGSVPSLSDVPPGCAFHPRCPWAEPGRCDLGPRPGLRAFLRREVACHRAEEIARVREEGAP